MVVRQLRAQMVTRELLLSGNLRSIDVFTVIVARYSCFSQDRCLFLRPAVIKDTPVRMYGTQVPYMGKMSLSLKHY